MFKIKSFSLIETIAVMLLSAFLLLMAWKGLQYVQYQITQEQRLMSNVEDEMLFRYRLQKDFASGLRLLIQGKNTFSLYQPYLKDTVTYSIKPEYVLRKEKKQLDSFFIQVKYLHLDKNSCQMRIGEQAQLLYAKVLPFSSCD